MSFLISLRASGSGFCDGSGGDNACDGKEIRAYERMCIRVYVCVYVCMCVCVYGVHIDRHMYTGLDVGCFVTRR